MNKPEEGCSRSRPKQDGSPYGDQLEIWVLQPRGLRSIQLNTPFRSGSAWLYLLSSVNALCFQPLSSNRGYIFDKRFGHRSGVLLHYDRAPATTCKPHIASQRTHYYHNCIIEHMHVLYHHLFFSIYKGFSALSPSQRLTLHVSLRQCYA